MVTTYPNIYQFLLEYLKLSTRIKIKDIKDEQIALSSFTDKLHHIIQPSLPIINMLTTTFFSAVSFVITVQCSSFITVKDGRLSLNDQEYLYVGTNFWYGANLASKGLGGDRPRLLRELDHLHSLGINNLRLQAGSEGPDTEPWRIIPSMQSSPGGYNDDILDGLDFLLYEMNKRQMYAVMCLNNFWHWSGGFAQYIVWAGGADKIPYPGDYDTFELFAARFYQLPKAVELFENHIRLILSRRNRYSNISYTQDPTIVSIHRFF
jgi:mannan endo-1,4-beta-mannosidase